MSESGKRNLFGRMFGGGKSPPPAAEEERAGEPVREQAVLADQAVAEETAAEPVAVQACKQFTQAYTYSLESDPPESPALPTPQHPRSQAPHLRSEGSHFPARARHRRTGWRFE